MLRFSQLITGWSLLRESSGRAWGAVTMRRGRKETWGTALPPFSASSCATRLFPRVARWSAPSRPVPSWHVPARTGCWPRGSAASPARSLHQYQVKACAGACACVSEGQGPECVTGRVFLSRAGGWARCVCDGWVGIGLCVCVSQAECVSIIHCARPSHLPRARHLSGCAHWAPCPSSLLPISPIGPSRALKLSLSLPGQVASWMTMG